MIDELPLPGGPGTPIPISGGEVHLWFASLGEDRTSRIDACWAVLSPDEEKRAHAFRFEVHRRRFVLARGSLRFLLAHYTDVPPGELRIEVDRFGKPALGERTDRSVHFNLAHSGDRALYGISFDSVLGVDFEEIAREQSLPEFAKGFSTPEELLRVEDLPLARKTRALLRLWTAKEAFLKAVGTGLQISPKRIGVPASVMDGETPPVSLTWTDTPEISEPYVVYPLPACEESQGGSAALALPRGAQAPKILWKDRLVG